MMVNDTKNLLSMAMASDSFALVLDKPAGLYIKRAYEALCRLENVGRKTMVCLTCGAGSTCFNCRDTKGM